MNLVKIKVQTKENRAILKRGCPIRHEKSGRNFKSHPDYAT